MERGAIEVAPLAYMRGRTLNNAYIILDERKTAPSKQMKMFLTRFGEGSRVVVTGDITQIDLPQDRKSGLIHALSVLEDVEGISQIYLTHKDVVRHDLVQRIIARMRGGEADRLHKGGWHGAKRGEQRPHWTCAGIDAGAGVCHLLSFGDRGIDSQTV
jgi:phosphate starvation-inducible PhoH-like protein